MTDEQREERERLAGWLRGIAEALDNYGGVSDSGSSLCRAADLLVEPGPRGLEPQRLARDIVEAIADFVVPDGEGGIIVRPSAVGRVADLLEAGFNAAARPKPGPCPECGARLSMDDDVEGKWCEGCGFRDYVVAEAAPETDLGDVVRALDRLGSKVDGLADAVRSLRPPRPEPGFTR